MQRPRSLDNEFEGDTSWLPDPTTLSARDLKTAGYGLARHRHSYHLRFFVFRAARLAATRGSHGRGAQDLWRSRAAV